MKTRYSVSPSSESARVLARGGIIEARNVSYAYGSRQALTEFNITVPQGSIFGLLGPNGAGKTTLIQILAGLRRPLAGSVTILGAESTELTAGHRESIGYVAEGQSLPRWMNLSHLEQYLAPLYSAWDHALADELRQQFDLDPTQKIGHMSRGEQMKAALLCALAPRPKLVIMDEPFTGIDVIVRDQLVRGILKSAGSHGWTVFISSHDIAELELLVDWVSILHAGRLQLAESVEDMHRRFKRVDVLLGNDDVPRTDESWIDVEKSGRRLTFLGRGDSPDALHSVLRQRFPNSERIDVTEASLREVFIATARHASRGNREGRP